MSGTSASQTFASVLKAEQMEGAPSGRIRPQLMAYPNSGEVWDAEVRGWKEDTAAGLGQFGQQAQQWVAEGASIIGGCCRTTPAHIKLLAQTLKQQ